MSDIILKLEYPIKDGSGTEITELHIRRMKAKDMRKMKGDNDIEQSFSLLSALTGLIPEDLDELDMVDVQRATAEIEKMQKGKSASKA